MNNIARLCANICQQAHIGVDFCKSTGKLLASRYSQVINRILQEIVNVRVSMPNYENDAKMKELILYVANASEHDWAFGAVKLNKILFYADFLAYLKRGRSITGQEYFAIKEGPAPKYLLRIRGEMISNGDIELGRVECGMPKRQERTIAKRKANTQIFSKEDLEDVDRVLKFLDGKTGKDVTKMSHDFAGWKIAYSKGNKTTIPLASVRFDAKGFMGFESPPIPAHLIEYGRQLAT
jgi:hypothetical protein